MAELWLWWWLQVIEHGLWLWLLWLHSLLVRVVLGSCRMWLGLWLCSIGGLLRWVYGLVMCLRLRDVAVWLVGRRCLLWMMWLCVHEWGWL